MPKIRFLTALLTALLLSGCALMQPRLEAPYINLVDFKVAELGMFQQRYLITLNVQNPNNVSIPVQGMTYALRIAGDDFARGVSPKAFTLPAYGETEVQVELSTNLLSTLQRLQKLMEMDQPSVAYELTGKLDVGATLFNGTVPFSNQGELKLR